MAWMSQEKKKALAPAIKAVLKKYGIKGSIAVRHHSTLVVNLKSGPVDFVNSVNPDKRSFDGGIPEFHHQVNTYWIGEHWIGDAQALLMELKLNTVMESDMVNL